MRKVRSNSAMLSYLQKALARSNSAIGDKNNLLIEPKVRIKETKSFNTKKYNEKHYEYIHNKSKSGESNGSLVAKCNSDDIHSLSKGSPPIDYALSKNDIALNVMYRRNSLIHAGNLIDLKVLRNLKNIDRPSQSVINIIIAYICTLSLVDDDNKLVKKHKVYQTCLKSLKNEEYILKITFELINRVDELTAENKKKLKKIYEKYLIGWDMRPSAFSDKFYNARIVLHFLILLYEYIEGPKQINKKVALQPENLLIISQ